MSEKDFDLICIGRSCVDLYSGEFGVPLERAMTFTKSVGGSPMNIAIGTSRLGLRVGAITGVGQEDNGRYLKWQLSCEGVDVSAVKTDPKRLTAMVLLSIRGDNDFPLIQYRENCADMGLTAEDIDPDYLARAGAVLVTGTHLSREGVRSATMKVLETAKRLGLKCILDIDFRPNLWGLQGHDAGSSRWAEASEQVTSEYKKVLPTSLWVRRRNSSSRAARPRRWKPCAKSAGSRRRSSSSSSGTRAAPRCPGIFRTASWMKWSIRGSR